MEPRQRWMRGRVFSRPLREAGLGYWPRPMKASELEAGGPWGTQGSQRLGARPGRKARDSQTHRHEATLKGSPRPLGGGAGGELRARPLGALEEDQHLASLPAHSPCVQANADFQNGIYFQIELHSKLKFGHRYVAGRETTSRAREGALV